MMNLSFTAIVIIAIILQWGASAIVPVNAGNPNQTLNPTENGNKTVLDPTWPVVGKPNNTKVSDKRGSGWKLSDYLRAKRSTATDAPDSAWGMGDYLRIKNQKNETKSEESWGEDLAAKVTDAPDSSWGMGAYLSIKKNATKSAESH